MDTEQFSISRSSRERCEVVTLAGELDMVNASNVSDTLDALSDSARPVVVDLKDQLSEFVELGLGHRLAGANPLKDWVLRQVMLKHGLDAPTVLDEVEAL